MVIRDDEHTGLWPQKHMYSGLSITHLITLYNSQTLAIPFKRKKLTEYMNNTMYINS